MKGPGNRTPGPFFLSVHREIWKSRNFFFNELVYAFMGFHSPGELNASWRFQGSLKSISWKPCPNGFRNPEEIFLSGEKKKFRRGPGRTAPRSEAERAGRSGVPKRRDSAWGFVSRRGRDTCGAKRSSPTLKSRLFTGIDPPETGVYLLFG